MNFENQDQKRQIVYDDFSIDELYKQIIVNSRENRTSIKATIEQISGLINDMMDLQLLSPQVSTYMGLLVKNDQVLLKLATALTKVNNNRRSMQQGGQGQLTDKQKRQLIEQVNRQINPIFKELKEIRG